MVRRGLRWREASGSPSEGVRIHMLGGFSVSVGSREVDEGAWRLKKAANLVKLLALAPQHRLHRERAMDLLWPDLGSETAANNLHQVLYVARRTLDPTPAVSSRYLRLRGEQLELCPEEPPWVDVEAFEVAASTARPTRDPAAYRTALDLYTGDLLPGDPYQHWVEDRREGLRKTYLTLLVELAELHEERQEFGAAIEALGKAVAVEPAHEEARVGLLRLYALSGRRAEALKQYERLKEILSREYAAEPEADSRRLYEEIAAGRFPSANPLPLGSPPEEPSDALQHNLPIMRTSFVGRERELAEVKRFLSSIHLLTLTGAGGCGKSRLALEAARELVGTYVDGVWFVELAGLSDPELVAQEVADVLGVREQPGRPLLGTLVDALRNRKMVVVLDNCEHLLDAAAHLVDALLSSCPDLQILATSREALGIVGEANWQMPSLSLPDPEHPPTVKELLSCESAQLFLERARQRNLAFVLIERNAQSIAKICWRLDGIPLAIELAAARVGVLSVEQISERLENSLKLLTTGSRTAAPRHRTLERALDWSYALLSEQEQTMFGRLSVFAGGWSLEAAEVVAAGKGIEQGEVLDLLSRLVDKSLVVAEASEEGALRYRMLEPVRQYAREKLEESGELEQTKRSHAQWHLTLAEEAEKESDGPGHVRWLPRLETEHDNLRAALGWSLVEKGDAELGLRLAGALWVFWFTQGHSSEGRGWLEKGVSWGRAPVARAKALKGAGWIVLFQGDSETAKRLLEESVILCRGLKDEEGLASSLNYLGYVALLGGREDIPVAELLEEALELKPRIKSRHTIANTLVFAALDALLLRGDWDETVALHEEALTLFREMDDRWGMGYCLTNLGLISAALGYHDQARALLRELMHRSRELDDKFGNQYSFFGLACVADSEGHTARAARLWGVSEAIRQAAGFRLPHAAVSVMKYESRLANARARLGEAEFEEAWAEGKAMSLEAAIEYALAEEEPVSPVAAHTPKQQVTGEPLGTLTRREEEVAALVAQELTNRQIADALTLSERTVDNHVRNVLKKLNLPSRSGIATRLEERRLYGADPG